MSRKRRRGWRIALFSLIGLLVVVLALGTAAVLFLVREPLAQTSGEVKLTVLDSNVEVKRDERGIPQIYADNALDLFRAQGYVTAQDRFFEMDYRRHVTAGRLSELVGENADALEADMVIRTMGWRQVAEQEFDRLEQSTKDYLQAYADGVNAYLADRPNTSIAVEYTVLGLRAAVGAPERWSPIDSLAWLKAMAWDLRGNFDEELGRAIAYGRLGDVAKVNEIYPTYPYDTNATILQPADLAPLNATQATQTASEPAVLEAGRDQTVVAALESTLAALGAVPELLGTGEGVGSNSWVVAGEHTASGAPLLANDPHLGISAPGIWYQVGLHCTTISDSCPFDVAGYSFSGFPGIVIGHNADLAWGFTNLGADVTDFYIEKLTGRNYLVDGSMRALAYRVETIKVNGGDDVSITVRSTVHGPIMSDVHRQISAVLDVPTPDGLSLDDAQYAVSLAWTALTPGNTADAVFELDLARDADDIARAAALFEVPSQNIVFATTDGHIGYQAPGKIPIRAVVPGVAPSNGTWPSPGWDSRYDWQGYVAADEMPRALDPSEGFIVAANQAVLPPDAGPFLTTDWDYGYRSQQIRSMIEAHIAAGGGITAADMSEMQMSQANPYAAVLVPYLLAVKTTDSFVDEAVDLLRTWDYTQSADSAAAAYFASVWAHVLRLTFHDDLPESVLPDGGSRWLAVVTRLLHDPTSPWWDDTSTVGEIENRDSILVQALHDARYELTTRLAKDPTEWSWGRLHQAAPRHAVLGGDAAPGFVRMLVNPDPLQVGGGSAIVDATGWDASSGSYEVNWIPSMRMVVDLAQLDGSTWVNFTGNSGQPGSTHYTDQFDAWAHGRTFAWPFSAAAVDAATRDTLVLTAS